MAKLSEIKFVIFDVETTGLEPESGDRVVEIGAVKAEGTNIIERFHSLINPGVSVSRGAFAVNGITSEMLENAPPPLEVIPRFMDFIKGENALFAYNANFDESFMKNELKLINEVFPSELLTIDILAMARALIPNLLSYKLSGVAKHFEIAKPQKHRAADDVEMSFEILQKLFSIFKAQGYDEFSYICNLFCIDKQVTDKAISERIAEIEEAISLGVKLKIRYFSVFRGEFTEREVMPLEIIKQEGKYCLVGYCHLRAEERTFMIDGILHLEIV
ncbi:MAG: exonuclease domain-containing protein [Candidatus Omnitrophota bacterium]|nr:exonuclease domain-containing protein [Candidatus Omnitrophota bacterium]